MAELSLYRVPEYRHDGVKVYSDCKRIAGLCNFWIFDCQLSPNERKGERGGGLGGGRERKIKPVVKRERAHVFLLLIQTTSLSKCLVGFTACRSPVWMIACSSNIEFELAPFASYNINVHDSLACIPTYRISCAQVFSSLSSTGIFPAPGNQAGNHPRRIQYSIQPRAPNANAPFRPLWHMPRPIRLPPLKFHTVVMDKRLNTPQQLNLVARPWKSICLIGRNFVM